MLPQAKTTFCVSPTFSILNSEVAVDLRDKVIVITGASSGFGEQIARRCARRGAQVVLAARSIGPLEQLAQELRARGGRALAVAADVTSDADVARLAATTLERFGHADVLVANAGFGVLERIDFVMKGGVVYRGGGR